MTISEESQSVIALSPSFCSSLGLQALRCWCNGRRYCICRIVRFFQCFCYLSLVLEAITQRTKLPLSFYIIRCLGDQSLHSPNEPELEEHLVDLFPYGVKRISASAYMRLSLAVVRYRILICMKKMVGLSVPIKYSQKFPTPQ